MQTILNSFSSLDKDDGAGIQFILRPADPSWRKSASEYAQSKREGKSTKKFTMGKGLYDLSGIYCY